MGQFLVRPEDLDQEKRSARLRGQEAHHLARVVRAAPGDRVEIFDGTGKRYSGRLASIDESYAIISDLSVLPSNEPRALVTLLQAPPKGDRWEWLIEKAVELGVFAIHPVLSEFTVWKPDEKKIGNKLERWRKTALEAAKQCERGTVPEICTPVPLARYLKALGAPIEAEDRIVCLERKGSNPVTGASDDIRTILAVGPEGGWSTEEAALFEKAGFRSVGLGPRILRSETAAAAALARLLAR